MARHPARRVMFARAAMARPALLMGMIGRGPMRHVLLPRMLDRVLDRIMDVVERELVHRVCVVVPLRIDLQLPMRPVVDDVLVEAGMGGRSALWRITRTPVVAFTVTRMPMGNLELVVQM